MYTNMYSDLLSKSDETVVDQSMNPFLLVPDSGYDEWRRQKLRNYAAVIRGEVVTIGDPNTLTREERRHLIYRCKLANFVRYHCAQAMSKCALRALGRQLNLCRLDNSLLADNDRITSIEVSEVGAKSSYIPYSNRPLNWHTDGYYNTEQKAIRAFIMHCVQPAISGGYNELLDHEIAYILLRDENPDYIRALMHPSAMIIPANIGANGTLRPKRSGPVFSVDSRTGSLHMRFSARSRHIEWRHDRTTQRAIARLNDILSQESQYKMRFRLDSGQGIVCNNVLHNRSGFQNGRKDSRLLYRARYYDRVNDTIDETESEPKDAVAK